MAGINQKLIVVPQMTSFEEVQQAMAKALNDLQTSICNQLPITNYQNKRITNVGPPQAPDDAVTLKYIQSGAQPAQPIPIVNPGTNIGGGGGGSSQTVYTEIPVGTINGTNTLFTVTRQMATSPSPILELNGVVQDPLNSPVDFTINGSNVVYAAAPEVGAKHVIWYWAGGTVGFNHARNFALSTDILNWGTSTAYKLLGNVSFGFWTKLSNNAAGIFMGRGKNGLTQATNTCYAATVAGVSGGWNIFYYHDYGVNLSETHTFNTNIPNDSWYYVGLSRDNSAKTVTCYLGAGATILTMGTFTYTNSPDGATDSTLALTLGNQIGGQGGFNDGPLKGNLEEHYLSSSVWTSTDHLNAMQGSPNASGLLLQCQMGNNPEVDLSGNGGSGAVTGTTLVPGH